MAGNIGGNDAGGGITYHPPPPRPPSSINDNDDVASSSSSLSICNDRSSSSIEIPYPNATPESFFGRERDNYLIQMLFARQDYDECMALIDAQQREMGALSEHCLRVKALIKRNRGELRESLQLFRQAAKINPSDVSIIKQIARSLFLLGNHRAALEAYDEATHRLTRGPSSYPYPQPHPHPHPNHDDWEILQNQGLCYMQMKAYDKAIECFRRSIQINGHQDITHVYLARAYTWMEDWREAIGAYTTALSISPRSGEILTALAILHLRLGDSHVAINYLGDALNTDPDNPKAILVAGSIIQDHAGTDAALAKYKIAASLSPNSPQIWNNIGMCFFSKQRFVAAIACLKKALYLDPFEWIVSYNLGLLHLNTSQWASAFQFLSASINLKPTFAPSYMYLGIALAKLEDLENACAAYDKAIELERDHLFELNYAITLYNFGELEKSREHLTQFHLLFQSTASAGSGGGEVGTTTGDDSELLLKSQVLDRLHAANLQSP
ncbi:hypothetical protein CBR_g50096 [Chara braunii]|uniref:Uncharacterized protein n=1 Tax=Chara braunii TaxID=69332 RepID=A0A388M5Z4_CHABU|nr:hypothetical protein CBR_g50096 [Chara braunii]|eukprot:GBG90004.1 hypothetical protein CBR_g50096 [Chara braunii]